MKKTLLLIILSLTVFALSAQITYKSFGDGWAIPMDANLEVDVNEDGTTDFYINNYPGELGFGAIFAIGCFTSPDEFAYNNINTRELTLHEEGDLIQLNGGNLYNYIDEGGGAGYSLTGGLADGWEDKEDVIIGFAVFEAGSVNNGWLRASIDVTTKELIIKEWAYTALEDTDTGGILAGLAEGADGTTSVNQLENIEDISISPNPASDRVQLSFDYLGNENLSIIIQNSVGKEVYRNNNANGNSTLDINTTQWANGIYFVRFETKNAIHTERLSVTK